MRDLVNVYVNSAANPGNLIAQLLGNGQVLLGVQLRPDDLHVDRRRQAEVQHLRGDVRRLKPKAQFGKLPRQLLPEAGDVAGGGMVILLEIDENLPVGRRNLRAVAQRHVDAAIGNADVVEHHFNFVGRNLRAKERLDFGEIFLGLFQPRSGWGPHVQTDLPGIDAGEKVATDQRQQPADEKHEQPVNRSTVDPAMLQGQREIPAVKPAEPFELSLNLSCVRQIQLFSKI